MSVASITVHNNNTNMHFTMDSRSTVSRYISTSILSLTTKMLIQVIFNIVY